MNRNTNDESLRKKLSVKDNETDSGRELGK
jgi:hypothetical protein